MHVTLGEGRIQHILIFNGRACQLLARYNISTILMGEPVSCYIARGNNIILNILMGEPVNC